MNRSKRTAVVCPQCGASLAPGAAVCQYCGSQISDEPASEGAARGYAGETKFCKFCGSRIPKDAVVCTKCGRQVEKLEQSASERPIIINNVNNAPLAGNRSFVPTKKPLNKWTAFFLCLFLGYFGAHKFYEGKTGLGVLYICTCGLLYIGVLVDLIVLLTKPNPYYI